MTNRTSESNGSTALTPRDMACRELRAARHAEELAVHLEMLGLRAEANAARTVIAYLSGAVQ